MAANNITIKDVAREAGVSIATVSYVINNRTDVKIKDETRKKVLQVINLLGYTPNQAAKALVSNRKSLLGVYLPDMNDPLCNAQGLATLKELVNYFHKNRFEILLLNDQDLCKCDQADAIICYNTERSTFFQLGDNNFIPLIALDCMVNDPLFYQLNSDPSAILKEAEEFFGDESYTVVMLASPNEEKATFFTSAFPSLRFISSYDELTSLYGQNLVVMDSVLNDLLQDHGKVMYHPSITQAKLDSLKECILATLQRTAIDQHNILIP
jgi:DNA-binding LacI/PurR family transcriptional regulator